MINTVVVVAVAAPVRDAKEAANENIKVTTSSTNQRRDPGRDGVR